MIKKFKSRGIWMILFTLCLSIILTGIPNISMAEEDDGEIVAIYLIKDGIKKEISFEDYEELLRQNDSELSNYKKETIENISDENNKDLIQPMYLKYIYYNESGYKDEVVMDDLTRRVSSYRRNETEDPITRNISLSTEVRFDASITLKTSYKDAIESEVGLGWFRSRSFKDEQMTIQPGYYGWYEFTPIMSNSWGYLVTYSTAGNLTDKEFVDSYSPRRMNGFADGILIAKTKEI